MISIIVPVYNTKAYLHRCVESILAQTYPDYEVLLVDDGSTDGSGAFCDNYAVRDPRFRVIHKPNGGLTSARNAGLAEARGEWIAHVDSDDYLDPTMLEQLLAKAVEQDADVVTAEFKFVTDGAETAYRTFDWGSENDKTQALNLFINSVWTTVWGSIAKRSLYTEHHLQSPPSVSYCEDFHLMVRLCYFARKVAHVCLPLYYYWQHGCFIMHNLSKKTEADEQWVYQDIVRFFREQGVYPQYRRSMCWRMLKGTQELVLSHKTWRQFRETLPEKKHYIMDCPYINPKLKFNMWCLTHHLSFISWCMLQLRAAKRLVSRDS